MSDEETDAAQFADIERLPETYWPTWARSYFDAWEALRDDRFYGAMGGLGRIYYTSIRQYAADHGLSLYPLATFVWAIDAEYIDWSNEQSKNKTE